MDKVVYGLFALFVSVSLICIALYIPRIWCWLFAFSHQKKLYNEKKNRLAIIVPAKNESAILRWTSAPPAP